jgi:WD40 repeat protein
VPIAWFWRSCLKFNPFSVFSLYFTQGEKLVYGCGRTVIIRGVQNPLSAELYTEHPKDVTVAKISPSGFYCASGDAGGLVKIWSTDNPEHPVKFEGQVLAGSVTDLQWSPDSQLVVAVGDGRECFGKVFAWDTGVLKLSLVQMHTL